MSIIEIASLASFLIIATIIFCGLASKSTDMAMVGVILLIVNLGIHACFQAGASWQHDDVRAKYILTPYITTPKITIP
jgi:hypothetical protein